MKNKYVQTPDNVKIINKESESAIRNKLNNSEKLLKDIYCFLLSNDSLDGDHPEIYVQKILEDIRKIKKQIDAFFMDNV